MGLAGKVLGPIGLLVLIASGRWPWQAIVLCVTNEFIWWIPFGLSRRDAWPFFREDVRTAPATG